jgi:hypothetical protein
MSDLGDAVRAAADQANKFLDAVGPADYSNPEQPTGADGRYIRDRLMPEFWEHFASKAKDYNDIDGFEPHKVLGIRGQFAEVWRKVWKLKNTLWDGRTLAYEGEREILLDMIGHCFLAISMIDADPRDGTKSQPPVMVAGEEWQGRTKALVVDGGRKIEEEHINRPDGSVETLYRNAGDQPWPLCGREKCINCSKATLRTVLQTTNAKILRSKGHIDSPVSVEHSPVHAADGFCGCDECVAGHA